MSHTISLEKGMAIVSKCALCMDSPLSQSDMCNIESHTGRKEPYVSSLRKGD